jgi:hypothetical protein
VDAVSATVPVGKVVVVVPVTAVVPLSVVVVVLIGIFFSFRGRGAGGGVVAVVSVVAVEAVSVAVAVVSVVPVVDVAVCVWANRLDPANSKAAANADVRMRDLLAGRAKQGSGRQRQDQRLVVPARDPEPDLLVFGVDASPDCFHKPPQAAEAMTT